MKRPFVSYTYGEKTMKRNIALFCLAGSLFALAGCSQNAATPTASGSPSAPEESGSVLPGVSKETAQIEGTVSKKANGYHYFDYVYNGSNQEAALSNAEVVIGEKRWEVNAPGWSEALDSLTGKKALGYWTGLYLTDESGTYYSSGTRYAGFGMVAAI
jgi:hypothetical protein